MAVNEKERSFEHPLYDTLLNAPGLSVGVARIDQLLTWGMKNALWIFPMATSCCGIEFMAAACSRVDLDRMGTIVRGTPRQADVMVIAGTITVKMAPRVKKLWDQMPEPKWAIAMGSCAISGDFYRDLYPTIPGIDTVLPVDVYVPGCPPNPEALMHGLLRLQERIEAARMGKPVERDLRPETAKMMTVPAIGRIGEAGREATDALQVRLSGLPSPDAEDHQPLWVPGLDVLPAGGGAAAAAAEAVGAAAAEAVAEAVGAAEVAAEAGAGAEAEHAAGAGAATKSLDPADEPVRRLMRERFGVTEFPADAPPLLPDVARHPELARALKDMGFVSLVLVSASHWPGAEDRPERFEVAFAARSLGPGSRLAPWRVSVEAGQDVPTLLGVFPAADWQEREQFDLFGVVFAGHPDLRRIMLPEDWIGHPLRKDYASDTACAPWR